jgi:hypothetical protein
MARTKQSAKKSTGAPAPRVNLKFEQAVEDAAKASKKKKGVAQKEKRIPVAANPILEVIKHGTVHTDPGDRVRFFLVCFYMQ